MWARNRGPACSRMQAGNPEPAANLVSARSLGRAGRRGPAEDPGPAGSPEPEASRALAEILEPEASRASVEKGEPEASRASAEMRGPPRAARRSGPASGRTARRGSRRRPGRGSTAGPEGSGQAASRKPRRSRPGRPAPAWRTSRRSILRPDRPWSCPVPPTFPGAHARSGFLVAPGPASGARCAAGPIVAAASGPCGPADRRESVSFAVRPFGRSAVRTVRLAVVHPGCFRAASAGRATIEETYSPGW